MYWNGASVINRCLEALFAQTFQDYEVILVDNGSTDGLFNDIALRWPQVQTLQLDQNHGFAVANNMAAKIAKGQWLALLNSDAFPEPGWLEELLHATDEHPDVFFFTSCQIQANEPHLLDGTGDEYNIGGIAWRRQFDLPVEDAVQVVDEVFSACAAAAFYPLDAFLNVDGFDEDFFSYLEDVDLGFRLRLKGYRCLYVPKARVYHVGSASLGMESEFAIYHSQRNMVWTYVKNMPGPYIWLYLPYHIFMNLTYATYYGLCFCFCLSWKSKRDALIGIPSILKKRKKIQAGMQIDARELVHILHFPIRKKRRFLGIFIAIPKLLYRVIFAIKDCRQSRQISRGLVIDSMKG